MTFIKPFTIYQKGKTHVYINQCHSNGRKTKTYAIRRDDETGIGDMLATIKWSGSWRQYTFQPEPLKKTQWSSSCGRKIFEFIDQLNKQHHAKWRKKK